ncbi:MAG: TaqI-like C-terminal specificity domain-containing protein [Rikenellaceae bacterium]
MNNKKILTQQELAAELEITADTLRNWQRMGVVTRDILRGGIAEIKEDLVRQGRLSSRANKLYKVSEQAEPNHWSEYESSLSDAQRSREGIFYTPEDIVCDMMATIYSDGSFKRSIEKSIEGKKFLDPCCGSGNFLVEALKLGFAPENIYGYDTDPKAVAIARRRVRGTKIKCADFLATAPKLRTKFDYIYTNPPWGKHLDVELRKSYTTIYETPSKADTTALFFIASLRVLANGGKVGFLVQEAVFNIGAYEWMRERMLGLKIECLRDYGRPFKGLLTGAQGFVIENREVCEGEKCWCNFRSECNLRDISSFKRMPKRIINFWATAQDMECIDAIYAHPHKILEGSARWGLGIVTGNNRSHCQPTQSAEAPIGVVRGSDIRKGGVAEPSLYISGDTSKFQQSAPRAIYDARVKLIYKFISSKLVFYADHKQRYPLNSANCIVVNSDFGATHEQIAELLNSEVMNWVFSMICHSYKILRSDIEKLPLHIDYFAKYEHFSEDNYCKYLGIAKDENGGYRKI